MQGGIFSSSQLSEVLGLFFSETQIRPYIGAAEICSHLSSDVSRTSHFFEETGALALTCKKTIDIEEWHFAFIFNHTAMRKREEAL
jgi:hypothetical protein